MTFVKYHNFQIGFLAVFRLFFGLRLQRCGFNLHYPSQSWFQNEGEHRRLAAQDRAAPERQLDRQQDPRRHHRVLRVQCPGIQQMPTSGVDHLLMVYLEVSALKKEGD